MGHCTAVRRESGTAFSERTKCSDDHGRGNGRCNAHAGEHTAEDPSLGGNVLELGV